MILTTDVAYNDNDNGATAAGILHAEWESAETARRLVVPIAAVAPYEPGRFYKRELPCLLALLDAVGEALDAIVIDGFVTLGAEGKPGLGRHLFEALGGATPVVGIAKSAFAGTPEACQVLRGRSKVPLYVTAAGLPLSQAKARVQAMHGPHRIPTLVKAVDRLCREGG